jgi:hypothetical protein
VCPHGRSTVNVDLPQESGELLMKKGDLHAVAQRVAHTGQPVSGIIETGYGGTIRLLYGD